MENTYFLVGIIDQDLSEINDLETIFQTHLVGDNQADQFDYLIQLKFNNGEISSIRAFEDGEEFEQIEVEKYLHLKEPKDSKIHLFQYLVYDTNGPFSLFGKLPRHFEIPEDKEDYTVNYFGKLNKEILPFIPIDELHLFC
ncbi:MAG: hypothetical protein AAGK97_06760, partial [Bacteroidota bacterium]